MIFKTSSDKPDLASKKASKRSYNAMSLFDVLTEEKLLGGSLHQKLLQQLSITVGVPDEYYDALYKPLITAFVEHVQVLPTKVGGDLCTLLNHGLARAYFAVDHYKKNNPDQQNHLHTYILFSAFLLREIGSVACGRFINVCTGTGDYLSTWRPFESSLIYQGEFYRIRDKVSENPELHKRLTPILAQKLMPNMGFAWIAEREDTLALWFALMDDQGEELPHYGMIYDVAQTYALEYFSGPEFLLPLEVREARELMHGENFFEWLKNHLESGKLSVNDNDSLVHEVDKGLLIDVDGLAKHYEKYDGENANKALKEFERMGLTYLVEGSTREMYRKYSKRAFSNAPVQGGFVSSYKSSRSYMAGKNTHPTLKGLVLKDSKLVSYNKPTHAASLSAVKGYGLKGLLTGGSKPAVAASVFKAKTGK